MASGACKFGEEAKKEILDEPDCSNSTINTDPFGNNTSVDPKGQQEPDVVALVGDPKALNQEETNNVDESTKLNETPNERSIINKKYLEKKHFIKDYRIR